VFFLCQEVSVVTRVSYAKLNKDDINKLQKLENEIGKIVLAYEPTHESMYATLSDDQVEQLRQLEKAWNVVLLAYKPK
jgi:hypothetical protein